MSVYVVQLYDAVVGRRLAVGGIGEGSGGMSCCVC